LHGQKTSLGKKDERMIPRLRFGAAFLPNALDADSSAS
jgi:hypothetical protein